MSVDPGIMETHSSFSAWVGEHKGLVIGGSVVAVLILAGLFMNNKTGAPASSVSGGPADLSGLHGGLVYVPTSTSFQTQNINEINSNDPNLTSISGTQTITGPTYNNPTTTINNPPPVHHPGPPPVPGPVREPPPPHPQPPTRGRSLIWDQGHNVAGGETLSGIASSVNRDLHRQGMPGSMSLTWNDLYGHNKDVVDRNSTQHGNPIGGGPWNNIFPGEHIVVPRWG